jgi:hypothetical protein
MNNNVRMLVFAFAAASSAGCVASRTADVLPGIPSGTRLVELAPDQMRTMAEWTRDEFGGVEPTTISCTDGYPYTFISVDSWIHDFSALPADCPTLVDSEVNFIEHLTRHCMDADFDPGDFVGNRGCTGP